MQIEAEDLIRILREEAGDTCIKEYEQMLQRVADKIQKLVDIRRKEIEEISKRYNPFIGLEDVTKLVTNPPFITKERIEELLKKEPYPPEDSLKIAREITAIAEKSDNPPLTMGAIQKAYHEMMETTKINHPQEQWTQDKIDAAIGMTRIL